MKHLRKLGMLVVLFGVTSLFSGCLLYSFSKAASIGIMVEDPGGYSVANEMVYMYSSITYYQGNYDKDDAYQVLATDSKGHIEFTITEIEMLYQDEASFVFVTYKGDKENGRAAVTVRKNNYTSTTIHNQYY